MLPDILPKDEYGFSRLFYRFDSVGKRDESWNKLCSHVNAPSDSIAIHVMNGRYFEKAENENMSFGATRAVRQEEDGSPAIMVYFALGLDNPTVNFLENEPGLRR